MIIIGTACVENNEYNQKNVTFSEQTWMSLRKNIDQLRPDDPRYIRPKQTGYCRAFALIRKRRGKREERRKKGKKGNILIWEMSPRKLSVFQGSFPHKYQFVYKALKRGRAQNFKKGGGGEKSNCSKNILPCLISLIGNCPVSYRFLNHNPFVYKALNRSLYHSLGGWLTVWSASCSIKVHNCDGCSPSEIIPGFGACIGDQG